MSALSLSTLTLAASVTGFAVRIALSIEAEEVLVISTKGEKLAVMVNYNTYLQIQEDLKKLQNLATRLHDVRMFAVDPGASRSLVLRTLALSFLRPETLI
jgi:hypothetical protein